MSLSFDLIHKIIWQKNPNFEKLLTKKTGLKYWKPISIQNNLLMTKDKRFAATNLHCVKNKNKNLEHFF